MKNMLCLLLVLSLPLVLSPFVFLQSMAQSIDNTTLTSAENYTGGLSAESVEMADSNATNAVINSTDAQNNTGGFSSESGKMAKSNQENVIMNTKSSPTENNTGGFSSESGKMQSNHFFY